MANVRKKHIEQPHPAEEAQPQSVETPGIAIEGAGAGMAAEDTDTDGTVELHLEAKPQPVAAPAAGKVADADDGPSTAATSEKAETAAQDSASKMASAAEPALEDTQKEPQKTESTAAGDAGRVAAPTIEAPSIAAPGKAAEPGSGATATSGTEGAPDPAAGAEDAAAAKGDGEPTAETGAGDEAAAPAEMAGTAAEAMGEPMAGYETAASDGPGTGDGAAVAVEETDGPETMESADGEAAAAAAAAEAEEPSTEAEGPEAGAGTESAASSESAEAAAAETGTEAHRFRDLFKKQEAQPAEEQAPEDPVEAAKEKAEAARQKVKDAELAMAKADSETGVKAKMDQSTAKRNLANAQQELKQAERMVKIEVQRSKNAGYFEQATKLSEAEDSELDELESEIEDVEFEEEFDADQAATKKKPKKHGKSKCKFTTQVNNITDDENTISELQVKQREIADTKIPLKNGWRHTAMDRLHRLIEKYETPLVEAIHRDLGITRYEAYLTELAPVHEELTALRKGIDDWIKPQSVPNTYKLLPTKFKRCWHPYGTVLIVNSWESPVANVVISLAEALAAGNTVTIMNSARTKRCNEVLASAFNELFKPEYVRFIFGGNELEEALLDAGYDKTLYFGPREGAPRVLEANVGKTAPTTLVLDGSNACFVDTTCDLDQAAERIMWGKMIHAGQTRYAPHYALVKDSIHKTFVNRTFAYIEKTYGEDPIHAKGYPRMFSRREYDQACELLDGLNSKAKVIYGGERDPKTLRIAPTVVLCESMDNPVFKKKIVGPILVVGTYDKAEEAFDRINELPTPPALYLFSTHQATQDYAMRYVEFGQLCINDCMTQILDRKGVHGSLGDSGCGAIGGMRGIEEFGAYRIVAVSEDGKPMDKWRETPFPVEGYDKVKKTFKYKDV